MPVGAHATVGSAAIHLHAIVASPDGKRVIRRDLSGPIAERVGSDLGRILLDEGAREILAEVYAA